jgi:hypothetical protein
MEIRFSRHAKRRAKLYGIPESVIEQIIANASLAEGENEIINSAPGFKFPLKIVAVLADGTATVVTSYPLKKRATK